MKRLLILLLVVFVLCVGATYQDINHQTAKHMVYAGLRLHYVELKWNGNNYLNKNVDTYNVYRTEDGDHVDTLVTGLKNPSFYDFTAQSKHSYSYLVSATNKQGKESGFVNIANVDIP